MTRQEIERIRQYADRYHMPPHWETAIRLCDLALQIETLADEPPFVPYQPLDVSTDSAL